MIEFIRFEERDGMLGAVIHPKHRILPLLRGHFCSRLPDESFLIYEMCIRDRHNRQPAPANFGISAKNLRGRVCIYCLISAHSVQAVSYTHLIFAAPL